MPTKSRSRTITRPKSRKDKGIRGRELTGRRLPRKRPPTHPGEMLLEEFLKPLAVTRSELAARLGVPFAQLNEIVLKKRPVTADTALRLAQVLGMSADFWLGLQQDWDLWHALRSDRAGQIAELERIPKPVF